MIKANYSHIFGIRKDIRLYIALHIISNSRVFTVIPECGQLFPVVISGNSIYQAT